MAGVKTDPRCIEKNRVKTADEMEDLLIKGQLDFVISYTRKDGEVMVEDAPFNPTDVMSYVLSNLAFFSSGPKVRVYFVPSTIRRPRKAFKV